jgi:hypothetical protein
MNQALYAHMTNKRKMKKKKKKKRIICLCWHQTSILPISVSQVAGITEVSHWSLAQLKKKLTVANFKGC